MKRTSENVRAALLIGKLNEFNYDQGEPLSDDELHFLNDWISQSEDNRVAYERLARKEWDGEDVENDLYIYTIESILLSGFKVVYGEGIYHHLRYFYLTARYVVKGLTDDEFQELMQWVRQSTRNQRVYDQFTAAEYGKKSIRVMKACAEKHVYQWFMEKYHPPKAPSGKRLLRFFTKPFKRKA
jgi:hypothetical protein